MPQEGQQDVRQGHGAGATYLTTWDFIAVIFGLPVAGLVLGIALALLWLGP